MANVIKTVLTYPLDGSTTDFNIPFEYLARKFVVVTLLGVDRRVLTLTTDYRFATRTVIATNKAWGPADGYTQIEIRRVTSATERLVDFTDGSILRAYDLNVAQIQTMHVAEEARNMTADTIGVNNDGHLDARGRRIVNLANAVDDRDAVPLGQLKGMNEGAWQARNQALQFRNEAEQFKSEAATSRTAAETARSQAETSKIQSEAAKTASETARDRAIQAQNAASASATAAGQHEQAAEAQAANSLASANRSKTEAARSKTEADRAKTEADKLANLNDFSGSLKEVTPTRVSFNRELVSSGAGVRSMTGSAGIPYTGAWREGKGEINLTVDESGNSGLVRAVGTPWVLYWNPNGDTCVSQVQYNLDLGNRQIKGSLEVGHGSNSGTAITSWGESAPGNWASQINLKWYAGGVQVGPVRGGGTDCQGLYRSVSQGKQVDYWQDPSTGQHRFYNNTGGIALTVHANGDLQMAWGGYLSQMLTQRSPKRWSWVHLGAMSVSNDAVLNLPFDVRGLRGFFGFGGERGGTVYKQFTFPPLDCNFQINRKGDWQVFQLTNNGTRLIRRYGWSEGSAPYNFYCEPVS
ncbi:tail fiber protein [Aeromonas phage avDM11-UST]|nr:tail fiber protein [Aeromonas phage avDM11-UST]